MTQNDSRWLKMTEDDPKWLNMTQNGSKCPKLTQKCIRSQWLKMTQYDSKWFKMTQSFGYFELFLVIFSHLKLFFSHLKSSSHFESFWVKLGHIVILSHWLLMHIWFLWMSPNAKKLTQNCIRSQWLKMTQNDSRWLKMTQNDLGWLKLTKCLQKMTLNDSKS